MEANRNPFKIESLSHPVDQIPLIRKMNSVRNVGRDDEGGRRCGNLSDIVQLDDSAFTKRRLESLHPLSEILI
jgi:hypothetical protein